MQKPRLAHQYNVAAIAVVLVGTILYGFSLDRYPLFYVDDAFFAFAPWRAAQGLPFAYAVSSAAPYGDKVWAYHGMVLPNLYILLFKVFGFSTLVSHLPDFLGAWLAALLLVLFLARRGYKYAALIFAILWCGDRAPQEVMYARMDGLALLFLVLAFLALELAWRENNATAALLCGAFCGLSNLTNPLCLPFAVMCFLLTIYAMRWKGALWFAAGYVINLPLQLALWHFHVHDSVAQFLWHIHLMQSETVWHSISVMILVLRWGRYWVIALVIFTVACAGVAVVNLIKKGRPADKSGIIFLLAAALGLAMFEAMLHAHTHPYYVVYFSVWPMLCFAILAEEHWKEFRYVAIGMTLIWCASAAWNGMRIRESIILHSQLSKQFLYSEVRRDVPLNAEIDTVPDLYSVPIEAGFPHYNVAIWFPEKQDLCPRCYLLITLSEFHEPQFIAPSNLQRRQVLYAGPAFPGAGPLAYPIVLLSPETSAANPPSDVPSPAR